LVASARHAFRSSVIVVFLRSGGHRLPAIHIGIGAARAYIWGGGAMKTLYTLVLLLLVPVPLWAENAPASVEPAAQETPAVGPIAAADVMLDELMFLRRPVVVFADSPADPTFIRQMQLIERDLPALDQRDVVVIVDTDPAAKSAIRQKLRPRGFSLVLMEKDLKPVIRKPLPWDVREIVAAIDKFPLRRQEMLERQPSGR
jgi:hypothetical protein